MSRRDIRPRLIPAVMADPDLSYRDKCYLLTVASIKAEHIDGKRRNGSKAMDERGHFALHVDYIARAMGRTRNAVREAREACQARGWLSQVYPGSHGRPATYQALVAGECQAPVRVGIFYTLESPENPHPYDPGEGATRVRKTPTLTYRTPDRPSPAPTSGGSQEVPSEVAAARSSTARTDVGARLAACPWHETGTGSPEDCVCTPGDRRRLA